MMELYSNRHGIRARVTNVLTTGEWIYLGVMSDIYIPCTNSVFVFISD